MELKDYTLEELKAELKRRVELSKAQKAEEMKNAKRCRNCKHCQEVSYQGWLVCYKCMARTYGKKFVRNYVVTPSQKACEFLKDRIEHDSIDYPMATKHLVDDFKKYMKRE